MMGIGRKYRIGQEMGKGPNAKNKRRRGSEGGELEFKLNHG